VTQPGATVQVTTTLTNGCTTPMTTVQFSLTAPQGYQVSPAPPVAAGDLQPGQTESTTWTVTVPTDAVPSAQLAHRATFDTGGQHEGVAAGSAIDVPADSLAALFDNVGITDDTATDAGDIDGAGSSLSAQALASQGVTPGSTVSYAGQQFSWPSVAAGQPDNVVAGGQALRADASGSTLGFLLTATYGPATGTGQIVYTDGTSQDYTITAPDWYSTSGAGDTAVTMTYRNRAGNTQQSHPIRVSYVGVPLQAGKTLATIVLPDVSPGATSGVPAMHIFAIATS
jgi:hypothetical protein